MLKFDPVETEARWEQFTRAVAALMEIPPGEVEEFVEVTRPQEQRDTMLSAILNDVFPRLSIPKREQFARMVHVLEQRPLGD